MNRNGFLTLVFFAFILYCGAAALISLCFYEITRHAWLMNTTVIFFISIAGIKVYKSLEIEKWDIQKTLLGIVILTLPITATIGSYLFIGAVYVIGVGGVGYKQLSIALYPEHSENLGYKY